MDKGSGKATVHGVTRSWTRLSNFHFFCYCPWLLEPIEPISQLCLTLCNPMDCNLLGSSVHGIFQARVPEWVSISDPGIEPRSPTLQADALPSEPPGKPHVEVLSCIWDLNSPTRGQTQASCSSSVVS